MALQTIKDFMEPAPEARPWSTCGLGRAAASKRWSERISRMEPSCCRTPGSRLSNSKGSQSLLASMESAPRICNSKLQVPRWGRFVGGRPFTYYIVGL